MEHTGWRKHVNTSWEEQQKQTYSCKQTKKLLVTCGTRSAPEPDRALGASCSSAHMGSEKLPSKYMPSTLWALYVKACSFHFCKLVWHAPIQIKPFRLPNAKGGTASLSSLPQIELLWQMELWKYRHLIKREPGQHAQSDTETNCGLFVKVRWTVNS